MSQDPAVLSIEVYRGTDPVLRFTLADSVDGAGNPIDITGWTTQFTIRTTETSPDPPTLQIAGVIDDVPTRKFTVSFTKAQTLALKVGSYACSFERTNLNNAMVLGIGTFEVKYDILNPKA